MRGRMLAIAKTGRANTKAVDARANMLNLSSSMRGCLGRRAEDCSTEDFA